MFIDNTMAIHILKEYSGRIGAPIWRPASSERQRPAGRRQGGPS